jgi:PAS domain S-box-containing protein
MDELGDYPRAGDPIDLNSDARVIAGQKRALELVVHGAPLAEVLDVIVHTIEDQSINSVLGSILLLDEAAGRLRHGAAPSLPAAYNAAIDGIAIGPAVGSCGTAAFKGETVVVRDLATDPLWANFKELALSHGLRACWSTPILSSEGTVLGTFALYHRVPTEPTERDQEIVRLLGHTAGLVIERDRQAAQRAVAEAALRSFIDNLPALAWTARADGHIDYYNRRWYEYTGTTFEAMQGWGWQRLHDPELLPQVSERWRRSLATGEDFEMEFTLRGADGVPRWFLTRVVAQRDAAGQVVRWFGTNTNIHDIKAAQALSVAMAEQSRETQRVLLEMRAENSRLAERLARLEDKP